jgi:hypothetical protein
MENFVPPQPENSFRIILELKYPEPRLDSVLLAELKKQNENSELKSISRSKLKDLFQSSRIQIKGQKAHPSSSLMKGTTYVDILGY